MEYSIKEMARMSGVTVRTLRWYDEIGLLTPGRVAENGYRYYREAQVDRLQDILYYRTLGVGLEDIRKILDDPSYNRLEALRSHLTALEEKRSALERLIASVQETICAEERNEKMNNEKKFEALKKQMVVDNEQTYGKEVRGKYGTAEAEASIEALANMTGREFDQWNTCGNEIREKLHDAVMEKAEPSSEAGREIALLHKKWLMMVDNRYNAAKHRGIAELYVTDERFTAYYDKENAGCARFLRDAVRFWIR